MTEQPRRSTLLALRRWANQLGLRSHKVFAVGFNKTGTSSLHALFQSLGLPSYHGVDWRACDDPGLLRKYDCFSDGIPRDLAKLDRMFPGAKFILQVRELDAWVHSRLAHIAQAKARNVHEPDPGWDTTEHSITGWIERRNTHHMLVLSHFAQRPNDLLVVNFIRDPAAATKICRFIGFSGEHRKPEKNVHVQGTYPFRHVDMLARCLARLGVPDDERSNDILCPSLLGEEMRLRFPADTRMLEREP